MAEFYVPQNGTVVVGKTDKLPGKSYRVIRGVYDVPDALANSHEANDYGIKPVNEMTDDEWRLTGHVKADWLKAHEVKPKVEAKAPVINVATPKPIGTPAPTPSK